ncbi:MAG: fluoride efflux transporter CrcB [Phycisphaeraceae bacterium]|nr:fluoride efflux transporter CrcB [Phycisphaeraceae bacterium]
MPLWQQIGLVALGGASGALCRFGGVSLTNHVAASMGMSPGDRFPFGTLAVNVVGCLIIGVIMGVSQARHDLTDPTRLLVVVGFLGSLTTFSAFGAETVRLLQEQRPLLAAGNVLANVVIGLAAVGVGLSAARGLAQGAA